MRRDVFQAIADPTRREIINLIAHRSMNVNALAENFTISRAAISLQVKILQECGLVTITDKGRERICEAQLAPLKEIAGWLDQYSQHWEARFSRLDKVLLDMDDKSTKRKKKKKTGD